MKTININLNVIFIAENTQPLDSIPCPRVNVFKDPIGNAEWFRDKWLTQTGNYNYSIELENGEKCGIDAFGWANNKIDINTHLPIMIKSAGENLDQIQKSVNITEAGTYHISVSIS
jgi:hypothetical protein